MLLKRVARPPSVTRRKKPFHKLWTSRFCGTSKLDAHTIRTWHTQLISECGDKTWTRLVIPSWQGNPISSQEEAHAIVSWLAEAADPQVFLTRRGSSHISLGVQVWCVSPDVQLLVHMMASPVMHLKTTFTSYQFAVHTLTMLNWML